MHRPDPKENRTSKLYALSDKSGIDLAVQVAYARLHTCVADVERIAATAQLILAIFDEFYRELCEYPYRAQRAFEMMDPQASIRISKERLGLYSKYIAEHGPKIHVAFPALSDNENVWRALDQSYSSMIVDRYEADIAFSFAHSLQRNIGHGMWRPVAYSFPPPSERRALSLAPAYRRLPVQRRIDGQLVVEALRLVGFSVRFRNEKEDADRIADRVRHLIQTEAFGARVPVALDVVEGGFFRDLTAFLVGRWVLSDGSFVPFVVALLNSAAGIYADAVLHRTADVHNLFSSALANFHVTNELYYQTCVFLFSLMPRRPLGLHYSTIGFNHIGKVAILNEIEEQIRASGQRLQRSPGFAGTVAIGFTFDSCSYHLKVIATNRPSLASGAHSPASPP
jgi:isocitrate dehydrogenase kinase/phosphatase